jgi:hypothetical protein
MPSAWNKLVCDAGELEEQVGSSAFVHESGSSSGD